MINDISVDRMEKLKTSLIDFKIYYIKNKNNKNENENIKTKLDIINMNSWMNVDDCIEYYKSIISSQGNISIKLPIGGFFFKEKISIQPIINDLIGKLELIINQHNSINTSIREMTNSIYKEQLTKLIKIKTFELLTRCKNYLIELQNLNIQIYKKRKYIDIENSFSYNALKVTIEKIIETLNNSVTIQQKSSRTTRVPQSRTTRVQSVDSDVYKEYEELLNEKKNGNNGGRIRKVKNANKKMNDKVVNKKTTNKIHKKYLVKK